MTRIVRALLPALLLAWMGPGLVSTALAQGGQEGEDVAPATFNRGIILYQRYCSNCHGADARGDGRIAHLLKVPPPNLRTLAVQNDGEFPTDRIQKVIDGRKGILLHGTREMPIWGQVFLDGEGPEAEAAAEEKILDLVGYLKVIQESSNE